MAAKYREISPVSSARKIDPLDHPVEAVVEVPGSKSMSNRALMLAALAEGPTQISNLTFSDDSRLMLKALKAMGFGVEINEAYKTVVVIGLGGKLASSAPALDQGEKIFVGNAGTAARFLPCLAALGSGQAYAFNGEPRMYERPMNELLTLLEQQGAQITQTEPEGDDARHVAQRKGRGYPFVLQGHGLQGGPVRIDVTRSTQFASGLLMAAPYAAAPVELEILGDRQQIPYVEMTAAMMAQFGVETQRQGALFKPEKGPYKSPKEYRVEPDLSAAAYFFAAAVLMGGHVTVKGTRPASMQGDIKLLKVLQHMGCNFYDDELGLTVEMQPGKPLKGVDVDANSFSDQALTLAALAPFCTSATTIRNVAHIRAQECDRIVAIVKNLRAMGIEVEERPDGVTIQPGKPKGTLIETFGDHRVAMAFSLMGLKVPGVEIENPACVAKTFENYWEVFDSLRVVQHG